MAVLFINRTQPDIVEEFVEGRGGKPGRWKTIRGKRARELVDRTKKPRAGGVLMRDECHEAVSLPSSDHGIDPDVPRYSPEGRGDMLGGHPLFANGKEIDEYVAKKQAKGHTITYDREK